MTMPKPDVEFLHQEIKRLREELFKANCQGADFENLWLAVKDDAERYRFLKTPTGRSLTVWIVKDLGVDHLDGALDAARGRE
jgi:hypothetical protein